MLQSLGIQLARERAAYFNDYEYAAALLGASPEALAAAEPPAPALTAPAPPENPYAAPEAPLPSRRLPLVLGDRWLGMMTILALVVLPLAMILLIRLSGWLQRK
jgi:hypothetical protein